MSRMSKAQHMKYETKGFTLIEAVVAATLFAFVVTSILGAYLSVLRLDRRTRAERALTENGGVIMSAFEKEITNGHIDYTSYSGGKINGNVRDLYLVNAENVDEHYVSNVVSQNLTLTSNGTTTIINPSSVRVTNLEFYISPNFDPYTTSKLDNEQPHVTVVMELTANYDSQDSVKLDLEDTFTEMYYPSRQ